MFALIPNALGNSAAGGGGHTVIISSDGAVWTFGSNANGQLGDGTTTSQKTPTTVSSLSDVTQVAAGAAHSLALKSDGSVWAWGGNSYGQLGDQTTTQRTSPVQVYGLSSVIAIAAGANHSVALTSGGAVWVWGRNTNGQIGDGTTTQSNQPVLVTTLSNVTAIGAGYNRTLAVKNDGTVWAWGLNANGQLGDASTTQRTSPVQMTGITGASAVAGGNVHSLVLKTDGTVRAVGNNFYGQLGDGTTTQRTISVSTGLTWVTAIAAGQHASYALKTDGSVWAWGTNVAGQLGDGTTTQRTSPTQATSLSGISVIAAGASHALAVSSTGVVSTWGDNIYGQLGDGTTTDRSTPGAISDANYAWKVGTPVFSVAAGTYTVEKTVVITDATADASIYYTLDGATPTESDTLIASGSSVTIDETRTLKARALQIGYASDGTRSFEWNANDELISITVGSRRTEFGYDGIRRRTAITERQAGIVLSQTRLIWCGNQICEERSEDGSVIQRHYEHGDQIGATLHFRTTDQVRNVSDVSDQTGSLLAQYRYDPWGRRTLLAGSEATSEGYTGHSWQDTAGLWLSLYRAYDPDLGRWISEDLLGIDGGLNLYEYADNSPISMLDQLGLMSVRNSIHVYSVEQNQIPSNAVAQSKITAAMGCSCRCVGAGWQMDTLLMLYGTILVPTKVTRQPKKDKNVVNTASATAHEYAWHINPAIDAARKVVAPYEQKISGSKSDC